MQNTPLTIVSPEIVKNNKKPLRFYYFIHSEYYPTEYKTVYEKLLTLYAK